MTSLDFFKSKRLVVVGDDGAVVGFTEEEEEEELLVGELVFEGDRIGDDELFENNEEDTDVCGIELHVGGDDDVDADGDESFFLMITKSSSKHTDRTMISCVSNSSSLSSMEAFMDGVLRRLSGGG